MGEVASSSIVPCRFSSAKRRMVSMGVMKSATTAMLWSTPEITQSLSDSLGAAAHLRSAARTAIDTCRKRLNTST